VDLVATTSSRPAGRDRCGAPRFAAADRDGGGGVSEDIPQRDALRLQLTLIGGNDPPTRRLEVRWRNARGKMQQQWLGVREIDRAVSAILNVSQIGDTFIGAAPRVSDGGTARDVEHSWAVWADLDDAEALERVNEFTPAPSMIITTGSGGGHAWWQLNRPLPGPWAQRANRRLAKALGGDLAATDPARVLRPAGTRNYKHEPPRPVLCVHLELYAYTADQIVGRLPDDRSYKPRGAVALPGRPSGRSLDALARVVREATEGERNAACTGQAAAPASTSGRAGWTLKLRRHPSGMLRSPQGSPSWRQIGRSAPGLRRWRREHLEC
jgi:hypothetical protein